MLFFSLQIESLKRINEKVTAENVLLKTQLQDMQATNAALLETLLERSPKCNTQAAPVSFPSNLSRPAESIRHPLPKGLEGKQADCLNSLRILLMASLLSRSCLPTCDLMKISQTLETLSASLKVSSRKPLPLKRFVPTFYLLF